MKHNLFFLYIYGFKRIGSRHEQNKMKQTWIFTHINQACTTEADAGITVTIAEAGQAMEQGAWMFLERKGLQDLTRE